MDTKLKSHEALPRLPGETKQQYVWRMQAMRQKAHEAKTEAHYKKLASEARKQRRWAREAARERRYLDALVRD